VSPSILDQPFVIGSVLTPVGAVPTVSHELTASDLWGTVRVRFGFRRMHYTVVPGLYALGKPDDKSSVLVTANYKLSFDSLRSSLRGRDVWILVLDTNGVNVWCAAGKGTFSTAEIVERIESSGLNKVVSHRQLIVPQLAGPGVAAHEVKKLSGFKVTYGPIRSEDLPAFLDAGFKASPQMRLKTFSSWERIVLIPVELVPALKHAGLIILGFLGVAGLVGPGSYWTNVTTHGLPAAWALLSAVLAGAVLTPVLLPWLPGRAFSVKGAVVGLVVAAMMILLQGLGGAGGTTAAEKLAWLLMITAVAAYLAMNFTGASTYTSLSGVKKEMRWAVPVQIATVCAGIFLWVGSLLMA